MTKFNTDLQNAETGKLVGLRQQLMRNRMETNQAIRAITAELDVRSDADALESSLAALREKHGVNVQVIHPDSIESIEAVNRK